MRKIPTFSVILIFVVLMIIGAGMIPLINIQYTPSIKGSELSVSYSWNGASAKLVEMDVTSKLEGVIASVKGVKSVSSVSRKGGGRITVELKNKNDIESIRFEISQIIRQVYKKLPEQCSYPFISGASAGANESPILVFTVNAQLPTKDIENYVNEHIVKEVSLIKGINRVDLSGANPYFTEVSYDPSKLLAFGITSSEIRSVIAEALSTARIVGSINEVGVLLKSDADYSKLVTIPIKNVDGRIIYLGDIVNINIKERTPSFYNRINGLNTINITVYPEKYVNTLDLCSQVKDKMNFMRASFPENFDVITSFDTSVNLKEELNKIILRTVLSLIILLIFVFAVSRSFRYLFIITIALAANILIAFIFYVMFDMEIHIYSLAGITVSLGIMIDTSIIMISHYGYYKNRKVFIAILAAQLTSIGALVVVFLLPEQQKANLVDFCGVIIINLAISLFVSMLFIPALVDSVGVKKKSISTNSSFKLRRRVLKLDRVYFKYIYYGKKYKWVSFVILILGFGIPVGLLPDKLGSEAKKGFYISKEDVKKDNFFTKTYNVTLGSDFFRNKIKEKADICLGGTIRLFIKNYSQGGIYREPARPTLYINASLPDGCTVSQLNEVVLSMENYLSQFSEIESFNTNISSNSSGRITVLFKKEHENTYFPYMLQQEVTSKAINFGGANWSVYGIAQQGFNNNIGQSYKSNRIVFTGYNYDRLYDFCNLCIKELSKNPRVKDAGIYGVVGWSNSLSRSEYYIDYDAERLAKLGLSLNDAFFALQEQLFSSKAGFYYDEAGIPNYVDLVSGNKEYFDVWHLNNEYIKLKDRDIRFSDIGHIEKKNSGNDIYRKDQQYTLTVAYDFVGAYEQANRVKDREIARMNSILPVGYKAAVNDYSWGKVSKSNVWLIFLIIAIIFFICAVLFESLSYPFVIIGLIPISFIGVFLIFSITGFRFDQGGYAALVMLCGIVVNAGIYILNEYKNQLATKKYPNAIVYYLRAFNHKIIPILLTILSTVLGLIPFLMDGEKEVFWFAFALGTIGGLFLSLIALIFFMPIWISLKK